MRPFFTVLAVLPILTNCSVNFIYENRKFFKQNYKTSLTLLLWQGGGECGGGAELRYDSLGVLVLPSMVDAVATTFAPRCIVK